MLDLPYAPVSEMAYPLKVVRIAALAAQMTVPPRMSQTKSFNQIGNSSMTFLFHESGLSQPVKMLSDERLAS
jgi:hypothetical protein